MIGNAGALPAIFFQTSYLENVLRIDAWGTGLRFLPLSLAMFLAGAVGGSLIGKVPFRVLLGGSTLVMGIGLLFLNLAEADSSWTVLIPCLVISGLGMGAFNPVRAALAIGVVEPARSGVASGINETFQQVGIAIGIAGVGAFFDHRVSDVFSASAIGRQLGSGPASDASDAISAGGIEVVARGAGALHDQVLHAAEQAYMTAFHDAMTVCAALGILAGVIGFVLVRTRDLHSSALSTVPPEVDEPAPQSDLVVGAADGPLRVLDGGEG